MNTPSGGILDLGTQNDVASISQPIAVSQWSPQGGADQHSVEKSSWPMMLSMIHVIMCTCAIWAEGSGITHGIL